MAQLSSLNPRPQDRGWGLAGAGRLALKQFQKGYDYVAGLGGSLMPFAFSQKVQFPFSSHALKDRNLKAQGLPHLNVRVQAEGLTSSLVVEKEVRPFSRQRMLETAVHVDQVAGRALDEPWWCVTGPAQEFIYFATDTSSGYRMIDNVVNLIQHRPDPTGVSGLGITSGASVLTGYIAGCRGYVANQTASKIHDFWGKVCGKVNMVRGVFEAAGGAVFIPVRALSIAAAQTSAKTVAQSALILGNIGSALFGITYLLLALPSAISMAKGLRFNAQLNEALEDPQHETEASQLRAGVLYLMDQLHLTRSDRKKTAHAATSDEGIWEKGRVKPIEIDPEDGKLLSQYDHDYVRGFVGKKFEGAELDEISLALIENHVKKELIHLRKTKEAELGRKGGDEVIKLIKAEGEKPEDERLITRLLDPEDKEAIQEAQSVIEQVKKDTRFNIGFNAAIAFFSVLGAVAFFAGIAGTGGTLGLVIAMMWVVTSVAMFAIDGYCLWQAYKNGDPKFKDKLMMSLAGVFLVTAVVLGTVFSGGLAPLIASGVIGLIWLGVAGYSYYRWSHKPQEEVPQERVITKMKLA